MTGVDAGQESQKTTRDGGQSAAEVASESDMGASAVDEALAEFAALGLGEPALRALRDLGFGAPTPVQRQTIPPLLAGRDIIAQAPTGTGKTAAYDLPLVERLDAQAFVPQALIVTPTPTSRAMSASASAVSGVSSVGLSTTRLLVAIAGASLCDTMLSG